MMFLVSMMGKGSASMGAIRKVRFEEKPDSIYRAAYKVLGMPGSQLARERSCLSQCKMEADCGGLYVRDRKCHLVASEVVALDPSFSMKTMLGVRSFAMVEESAFVSQPTPVPSMDQYSLMSGGSQSLTTYASGGDAWEAPEGTYTVPPTEAPSVTSAYDDGSGCVCSGSGWFDYGNYGSGSDYGDGSSYGEYGPGGGSGSDYGEDGPGGGSGSDYGEYGPSGGSGSDYFSDYSGSGSGCYCSESDPCQGEAAGNGECMCEEHGYSENQCSQIGCCQFDNGECWSAVGDGQCSGSGGK